jgi:hypothetical protein
MFDDIFAITERLAETFRSGVRDTFGASIIANVLDPIHNQIGQLRSLHEEVQSHSLNVEQVLQDARSMTLTKEPQQ